MRYSVKECELYGLRNPFLFFSGWVERAATKLIVMENGKVCYEYPFSVTKSKIHTFSLRTGIKSTRFFSHYEMYVEDSLGRKHMIYECNSTPVHRLLQKLKPNKYRIFSKKYLKAYKHLFDRTYDLRNNVEYNKWIKEKESFNPVEEYDYNPLISIIIPVYNVSRKYLSECLDSILNQTYQNFEICLADDCSPSEETRTTLKEYALKDKRIKVCFREKNGHISEASNSALAMATGEFVGMMDNDDFLMPQALNEIVRVLNENRDLDFIYTDEDKIDLEGNRSDPQFKPDLALDKLYGGNYICHFNIVRREIMEKIGGFRKGYEGAQDFDLFIRIAEVTDKFYHIPKILYHWRMIPGSTALDAGSKNYAGAAGKRALEDLMNKKNVNAQVDIVVNTHYSVEYILDNDPKVGIIINVNEEGKKLKNNIHKMMENLAYKNLLFIFVCDNINTMYNNLENSNFSFECIKKENSFALTVNKIINSSDIEYFLFLDEKGKIDTFDALDLMCGYCSRNEFGLVGAKILNKNHFVVDSGYFLVNKKLLPTHLATYAVDYGNYGNLLVPNNYRVIEDAGVMISKSKFVELGGLDSDLDDKVIFYDLCLRCHSKGYRNIILPRVEISVDRLNTRHNECLLPLKKWENIGEDIENDLYYNVNLSNNIAFRLDK